MKLVSHKRIIQRIPTDFERNKKILILWRPREQVSLHVFSVDRQLCWGENELGQSTKWSVCPLSFSKNKLIFLLQPLLSLDRLLTRKLSITWRQLVVYIKKNNNFFFKLATEQLSSSWETQAVINLETHTPRLMMRQLI